MKIWLIIILALFISCKSQTTVDTNLHLIPTPYILENKNQFSSIEQILISEETKKLIADKYNWIKDWPITTIISNNPNIKFKEDNSLMKSGYTLDISENDISIHYNNEQGISLALGSIYQLLLLNDGKLPQCKITDGPIYGYRGMHLDVARHMYTVEEVKKYIDYLSIYKYNYFHWHLTEDQGWRIEIKKYPKLQSIAAYRDETLIGHYNDQPQQYDGKKYGGYYKQEEIKDIVNYASNRGIEIIPEIDVPGHSLALLSAYPELGCVDKKYKAATKWGVFLDVLCPKEETFTFLENVFSEIIDLFPSRYIHIGGDECPKDQWKESPLCQSIIQKEGLKDEMELQSYFIRRIEKYINSKGKKIIGWDEILEGGIAPNATVMSWRGVQGGIEAANKGHDVIMTPTSHCYYDYYQSQNDGEPLAIGGYTPYQKVYDWSPVPEKLNKEKHKYILGGQGNVWTEYMPTFDQVEYMSLTRMMTLSEVLWGKNSQSIDKFNSSLYSHTVYWANEGSNIANHLLDITTNVKVDPINGVEVIPTAASRNAIVYYKDPKSTSYNKTTDEPIYLNNEGEYLFYSELNSNRGATETISFNPHKGNKASIQLKHQPSNTYRGNGAQSLINGILGPDERYGGSEWLGFSGDNLEADIAFAEPISVNHVKMKFFKGEGQWIYLPKEIKLYSIDTDGSESMLSSMSAPIAENKIATIEIKFPTQEVRKLKIVAKNFGLIPEGRQGGGHPAWLFVDEIEIR